MPHQSLPLSPSFRNPLLVTQITRFKFSRTYRDLPHSRAGAGVPAGACQRSSTRGTRHTNALASVDARLARQVVSWDGLTDAQPGGCRIADAGSGALAGEGRRLDTLSQVL